VQKRVTIRQGTQREEHKITVVLNQSVVYLKNERYEPVQVKYQLEDTQLRILITPKLTVLNEPERIMSLQQMANEHLVY